MSRSETDTTSSSRYAGAGAGNMGTAMVAGTGGQQQRIVGLILDLTVTLLKYSTHKISVMKVWHGGKAH